MAPAPPSSNLSSNNNNYNSNNSNNNNNNNSNNRSGNPSPTPKRQTVTIVSSAVAAALLILMVVSIVIIIRRSRRKRIAVLHRAYVRSSEHDEAATKNSDVYGNHIPPAMEKVPYYPPSSAPKTTHQKSLSEVSVIEVPPPVHFDSSLYNPNPQSIHQASHPPSLQAPGAFHEPYYGFSQGSYGQPDPSAASYQYYYAPHTQYTPK